MKLKSIHNSEFFEFYVPDYSTDLEIPFFDLGISAGFPSPAQDFTELRINLNKEFIKNQDTTFILKVKGHSMKNIGIFDDDFIIVDKSLEPQNGKIAVCQIDSEFTIKRIKIERKVVWLIAENEEYAPIKVTAENELIIWGIVIHSIRSF